MDVVIRAGVPNPEVWVPILGVLLSVSQTGYEAAVDRRSSQ